MCWTTTQSTSRVWPSLSDRVQPLVARISCFGRTTRGQSCEENISHESRSFPSCVTRKWNQPQIMQHAEYVTFQVADPAWSNRSADRRPNLPGFRIGNNGFSVARTYNLSPSPRRYLKSSFAVLTVAHVTNQDDLRHVYFPAPTTHR